MSSFFAVNKSGQAAPATGCGVFEVGGEAEDSTYPQSRCRNRDALHFCTYLPTYYGELEK